MEKPLTLIERNREKCQLYGIGIGKKGLKIK